MEAKNKQAAKGVSNTFSIDRPDEKLPTRSNLPAIMKTIHKTGEATGFIPLPNNAGKPITVIGTDAICDGFDET